MEEPSVRRARSFPVDIVSNIFLKLPVKSILRYRCVSKVLCKKIDSPSFANKHHRENAIFMWQNKYPNLAWSLNNRYCISYLAYGLFCLFSDDESGGNAFLYNHLRGEVMILPQAPQTGARGYGLGFDATTDTYKIVRFAKLVTEVLTLGTRSWRQISSRGPPCHLSSPGVSAHGDIHWKMDPNWDANGTYTNDNDNEHSSSLIISFDSRTEEFNWTPHPYVMEDYETCKLVNVRGSLAIIGLLSPTDFDIWVMKDYDTKRWAREYRISNEECLTIPGEGSLVSLKNYGHLVDAELVVPAFSCVLNRARLVYILP